MAPVAPTAPIAAPIADTRTRVSAVSFQGRNGSGEITIAVPAGVRVSEGPRTKLHAFLLLDGVDVDARLEGKVDVTRFGSPVRSVTTSRDPRVAGRVVVELELIVPSTTTVGQAAGGVRWTIREDAAW
jgi:hypothetical protein